MYACFRFFVRIVIIKVDVSVCVIRADFYTCIEKEFICKFTVGEKPYGHRIIVMSLCICEIRDRDRIHELYVDVQFFCVCRIRECYVVRHFG